MYKSNNTNKEGNNLQPLEKNISNKQIIKKPKVIFFVEKNLKDINTTKEAKNNIKEDYISTDSSPKKVFFITDNNKDNIEEYIEIVDNQPEIKIKLNNSTKINKDDSVIELLENISDEKEIENLLEKSKNNKEIIIPIKEDKNEPIKRFSTFKKSPTVPFKRIKYVKKAEYNESKKNKNLEYILIENKKDDSFWNSTNNKNNQKKFLNKKRMKKDIENNQENKKLIKKKIFKKLPERAIEKIKEKVKEKEKIEKNNIIHKKNINEIKENPHEKYLKDLITNLLEGKLNQFQKENSSFPISKIEDINKNTKILPKIEIKKDQAENFEKKSNEINNINNIITEEIKTDNLDSKNTLFYVQDINEKMQSNSSSNRETSLNVDETHEDYGMQTLVNLINNNGLEKIINYLCMDNIDKDFEIEEKLNSLRKNFGELKLIVMLLKICLFNKKEKYENQNNLKNENEKKSEEFKYPLFENNFDEKIESLKMKINKLIFSELGLEADFYNKYKNKNFIPKYFRDRIHSIVRMKGNKQSCYFCNKDKIDYFCENCMVPIHLHCFKNYHNNFIYS